MKNWLYTIVLGLIIGLIVIQVANGIRFTYYNLNDITHVIKSDYANCIVYYDFFGREMACATVKEIK
ncbi:hypothetical protein VPHK392_0031 [Vibrio phage K392]